MTTHYTQDRETAKPQPSRSNGNGHLTPEQALLLLDGLETSTRPPPSEPSAPSHTIAALPGSPCPGPKSADDIEAPDLREILQQDLARQLGEALKLEPEDLSPNKTWMDYGLDSVASTELTSRFETTFAISVPPTIFFEFQNLEAFTDYLIKSHREQLEAHYSGQLAQAPLSPAPVVTDPPHARERAPSTGQEPATIEALWNETAVSGKRENRPQTPRAVSWSVATTNMRVGALAQPLDIVRNALVAPTVTRDDLEASSQAVRTARLASITRPDGRTVEYAVYGDGPPVLVLGGLVMHYAVMWQLQLSDWGRNRTLIMPHMPGCGGSQLTSDISLDTLADDVDAVLAAEGHDAPLPVIGYSFGGVWAQALTLRHPGRVSALAICVSTAHAQGADDFMALMRELQKDPVFMEVNRGWPMQALPSYQEIVKDFDFRDRLSGIDAPALVVAATDDAYMTLQQSREIAEGLPRASLHVFEGAGHLLGFTSFRDFNPLIARFLETHHADLTQPARQAPAPVASRLPDESATQAQTGATLAAMQAFIERGEAGHTIMLSPAIAHAAYLLNRFIARGRNEEPRYNTYFQTSAEEALDAALRAARHLARNQDPSSSGRILVVDPNGALRCRFAPLLSGEPLISGLDFVTSADEAETAITRQGRSAPRIIVDATPASSRTAETERLSGLARQLTASFILFDDRPGLFENQTDDQAGPISALEHVPDFIVFGKALSGGQIPCGAMMINADLANPWLMTPNEGYVRHPMANLGFAQRLVADHLTAAICLGRDEYQQLRAIETDPEANHAAHVAYGNVGYARVAKVHGFDRPFSDAHASRSRIRLPDQPAREIVDCLSNVGCAPRGTNPSDVIANVVAHHDTAHNYWADVRNLLAGLTGLEELLPAPSYVSAIDHAIALALLAAGGDRHRIITFTGAAGFYLTATAIAKDPLFDSFRAPFHPLGTRTVFIDPDAADAAERFEREVAEGDVALVWLEPVQVEGHASRPLPDELLRLASRMKREHGYLLAVDETQTALWTGHVLQTARKVPEPDIVVLGTALTDALLPAGGVLTRPSLLAAARHANPSAVDRYNGGKTMQLAAHLAKNALEQTTNPDHLERVRTNGSHFSRQLSRLAATYPLARSVRGEGLLQTLELDLDGLPAFVRQSFGYLLWGHMLRDPDGGMAAVVCPLHNNCLRFAPPLDITRVDLDAIVDCLERALSKGAAAILADCSAYTRSRSDSRTADFFSKLAKEVEAMDLPNARPAESHHSWPGIDHTPTDRLPAAPRQASAGSPGRPKVCVIGSGVGGINAIKALADKGLDFDCFEARDQIGGIWAYDEDGRATSTWKHLNMNTPKGHYQFEDFPMPEDYPDYPRRQQVQDYLLAYLEKHGLRDRIETNAPVRHAKRLDDGTWRIELGDGRVKYYSALVVANGHHNTPAFPEYADRDSFEGEAIHSKYYRTRLDCRDKRVMIVGVGNSGAQIAVDVSHDATITYLSLRRGVYILPHYLLGMRVDHAMGPLNAWWVKKLMPYPLHGMMMTAIYNLVVAKHSQMGMPKPDHWMLDCLPTMSENLGNRIGDGKVKIVGEIDRIEGKRVHFKDGSNLEVDKIIYSTGYQTDFPFFDEDFLRIEDNRIPFYKRIFHPEINNLAFIGLFQAIDWGFLGIMERQSKIMAGCFAGDYALPEVHEQKRDISREQRLIRKEFMSTLRNNYYLHGPTFMRELKRELARGEKRARRGRGLRVELAPPVGDGISPARHHAASAA